MWKEQCVFNTRFFQRSGATALYTGSGRFKVLLSNPRVVGLNRRKRSGGCNLESFIHPSRLRPQKSKNKNVYGYESCTRERFEVYSGERLIHANAR
jgi:hypothetical protein